MNIFFFFKKKKKNTKLTKKKNKYYLTKGFNNNNFQSPLSHSSFPDFIFCWACGIPYLILCLL